jgi:hypothetical protein
MEAGSMDTLDIQIIKKNGKKECVILPYKEFFKSPGAA